MTESKAKRIKILDLLEGYSSLMGRDLSGLTRALGKVADDYPGDVVEQACARLARTNKYPPTPAEMEGACSLLNTVLHPKVVELYNGLIKMDWGRGTVKMAGLTTDEQDKLIKLKGMLPDGRNAAGLSLEEKRDGLSGKAIERKVTPRLRSMK